jgi:hypothetical protein
VQGNVKDKDFRCMPFDEVAASLAGNRCNFPTQAGLEIHVLGGHLSQESRLDVFVHLLFQVCPVAKPGESHEVLPRTAGNG